VRSQILDDADGHQCEAEEAEGDNDEADEMIGDQGNHDGSSQRRKHAGKMIRTEIVEYP
jgi:hypothetical protein